MARKRTVGVVEAPQPAETNPAVTLTRQVLAGFRSRLTAERDQLLAQAHDLEEAADVAAAGEVGFDEEYADAGTVTFERERDLSLSQNARDLVAKIERALERMDHGTFGRCQACGRPIEPERLDALPYAAYCLADARRRVRLR
ncbi:MAG TPA: TraR/DksA C4-type zinc finger protein [Actinomycetes bacterium]